MYRNTGAILALSVVFPHIGMAQAGPLVGEGRACSRALGARGALAPLPCSCLGSRGALDPCCCAARCVVVVAFVVVVVLTPSCGGVLPHLHAAWAHRCRYCGRGHWRSRARPRVISRCARRARAQMHRGERLSRCASLPACFAPAAPHRVWALASRPASAEVVSMRPLSVDFRWVHCS